nr:MAG TPA: hypothetical protein [Caudoviricetes sp.]
MTRHKVALSGLLTVCIYSSIFMITDQVRKEE